MKIVYLGHSCFYIESETGVSILTDPYTRVGYELPKSISSDIVLISHAHFDHNYVEAVEGTPIVVSSSGSCLINGVKIEGFDSWHDERNGALRGKNILFHFAVDGIKFCHFGDLGQAFCEDIASKLADADVWLIPVGGTYTITVAQAVEYIEKLAPKLVIPMHYRPQDGALDIAGAEEFLSKFEGKRVICCKNGKFTLDDARLQELTGKILYMERCK